MKKLMFLALLLAATTTITFLPHTKAATGAVADPAIVEKLREIVSIRQMLAEYNEHALKNGKGAQDGSYKLALADARLQLARELGHADEQIAALKEALKVQQDRFLEVKARAAAGAASPEQVESVRAAFLEAEVKLLREQK